MGCITPEHSPGWILYAGRMRRCLTFVILLAACGGDDAPPYVPPPAPYCTPKPGAALKLTEVATGLRNPVFVTSPPGDGRVFIVEQPGRIRVMRDGSLLPTPYLDIQDRVNPTGNEQGLLGLAFHPAFATNGKFYVHYTSNDGSLVIAEYTATPAADVANTTERRLMAEPHNYDNHNGGTVAFGNDGFLYISMGDGGGADNFLDTGQDPDSRLAKILRIDVDSGDPYGIPSGNPWAGGGGVPEMFAWGLRNPYRFSIDPSNGDMYIGDVGQGTYEEVDYVPAGSVGLNFGWAVFEGPDCFTADPDGNEGCDNPGMYRPAALAIDRRNNGENSVIGGVVYRGTCLMDYPGTYFYGDYGSGHLKTLRVEGNTAVDLQDLTREIDPDGLVSQQLSSIGVDAFQELYVTAHQAGRVYRIEVE